MGMARDHEGGQERENNGGNVGIRKDLVVGRMAVDVKKKGIIVGRVRVGEERWRIIGVYVRRRSIGRRCGS